jgi:hypothetical protein
MRLGGKKSFQNFGGEVSIKILLSQTEEDMNIYLSERNAYDGRWGKLFEGGI